MRFNRLFSLAKLKFTIIFLVIFIKEAGFLTHIFSYKFIFEYFTEKNPTFNLTWSLILLLMPLAIFIIFTFLKGWIFSYLEMEVRNKLSDIIIKKIQKSNYSDLKYNKNAMLSWFNYDLKLGLNAIENLLNIISPLVSIITGISLMIVLSPQWGWILIVTTLILSLILLIFQGKISNAASKPVMKLSSDSETFSNYNLGLLNSFKSFFFHNKNEKFKQLFYKSYENLSKDQIKQYKKLTKLNVILTVLFSISIVIVLTELAVLTSFKFYSLAIFLSLLLYSNRFSTDMGNIVLGLFGYKQSSVLLDKILEKKDLTEQKTVLEEPINKIDFENVSFSYKDIKVLENFNFSFEKNKKYLVSAPNGTGKSTLIKLISGVYDNYLGKILINGNYDQKELDQKYLRKQIGFIDNQNLIFEASLKNNITLFDENPDYKKLNSILKSLKIEFDIEEEISASKLSEGQKQKIAFARLKYSPIKFWLIDEAFDNIQKEYSQILISQLLENPEFTVVFISHHINEWQKLKFDQIIELGGKKYE